MAFNDRNFSVAPASSQTKGREAPTMSWKQETWARVNSWPYAKQAGHSPLANWQSIAREEERGCAMAEIVCPWWVGYLLASPIRRWWGGSPEELLGPIVREGMTVLEPGPGMGFFTLPLARMVGPAGRVIAVDIQPRMLKSLQRRAAGRGLGQRIEARLAAPDRMELDDLKNKVDFVLAFAVVHETPSAEAFFSEVADTLRTGGLLLFAEPSGHVDAARFNEELGAAQAAGLDVVERPNVRHSLAAVFKKKTA